ncbi:hypothetical protein SAMN04515647_2220 [Cohaesibacter sp. ES.047]|nr:hypothetical protein SAMN04515647_2220 [Cohaesibacter sp. ES.047]
MSSLVSSAPSEPLTVNLLRRSLNPSRYLSLLCTATTMYNKSSIPLGGEGKTIAADETYIG